MSYIERYGIGDFAVDMESKSVEELIELGKECSIGNERSELDQAKGMCCFELAAMRGSAEAKRRLTWFYFGNTNVVEEDPEKVVTLLTEAYEEGDRYAVGKLGYSYYIGYGVEKNHLRAEQLLQEGADRGDLWALFSLGAVYGDSDSEARDDRKFFEVSKRLANAEPGDDSDDQGYVATAQWDLAQCYLNGRGVEPDKDEGMKWLEKGAESGDAWACVDLGRMLALGDGVDRDGRKAETYLQRVTSLDEGDDSDASAQYYLGKLYEEGIDVEQDSLKAEQCFKFAANKDHARGQYGYAIYLLNRSGSQREREEAISLLKASAEQGYTPAVDLLEGGESNLISIHDRFVNALDKDMGDPEMTEHDVDVDEYIDIARAYWYGIGCEKDHAAVHCILSHIVDQSLGLSFGASDSRLAWFMAALYHEGGIFDYSGRDEILWKAVAECDVNTINESIHEWVNEKKYHRADFWADVAGELGSLWAAKMAVLLNSTMIGFYHFADSDEQAIRSAVRVIAWAERLSSSSFLESLDEAQRSVFDDEALFQIQESEKNAYLGKGRAYFRMGLREESDWNKKQRFVKKAQSALSEAYSRGSNVAGAFYVVSLTYEDDGDIGEAAAVAMQLLSTSDDVTGLIEYFDNQEEHLPLGNTVLVCAAMGCTGEYGDRDLGRAHDLFEMAAQRGDESAASQLKRFRKKLLGGWSYS